MRRAGAKPSTMRLPTRWSPPSFACFPARRSSDVKFDDEPEKLPVGPAGGDATFEDTGDWTEGFIDEMPDPGLGDFDD